MIAEGCRVSFYSISICAYFIVLPIDMFICQLQSELGWLLKALSNGLQYKVSCLCISNRAEYGNWKAEVKAMGRRHVATHFRDRLFRKALNVLRFPFSNWLPLTRRGSVTSSDWNSPPEYDEVLILSLTHARRFIVTVCNHYAIDF